MKTGFYIGNGNGFSWISQESGMEFATESEQLESELDSEDFLDN